MVYLLQAILALLELFEKESQVISLEEIDGVWQLPKKDNIDIYV